MEETVENWQKHSRRYLSTSRTGSYKKIYTTTNQQCGFNTKRWIGPISIKNQNNKITRVRSGTETILLISEPIRNRITFKLTPRFGYRLLKVLFVNKRNIFT